MEHVVAVADREKCVQWMEGDVLENSKKGVAGRAVERFPGLFRATDRRVNLSKAQDWVNKRSALQLALEDGGQRKYARSATGGRHLLIHNALTGRGRNLDSHWEWFYPSCLANLSGFGGRPEAFLTACIRHGYNYDRRQHSFQRIQDFTERHNIVYRKIKGKKQVSDAKTAQIEQSAAYHLDRVKHLFDDGVLDPDQQYTMDESHFIIDLDDGKTLDFRDADKVKYRSIFSGREGITMCVLLRGGSDVKRLYSMLIFKNKGFNYPIQGLPDAVDGISDRSSPSAFINNNIMQE
ncbi:hypothetical protein PHMEG_00024295 [Phytophthora megakarya]|uniref:Uncharacterized protein n=1 Tax=Phytophthora megakarya TaxID=4795 RepID=A0A225VEU9_9STRA|nr:hypothetical protein PHMEG_00024295 [Phytophthora megakarya]